MASLLLAASGKNRREVPNCRRHGDETLLEAREHRLLSPTPAFAGPFPSPTCPLSPFPSFPLRRRRAPLATGARVLVLWERAAPATGVGRSAPVPRQRRNSELGRRTISDEKRRLVATRGKRYG